MPSSHGVVRRALLIAGLVVVGVFAVQGPLYPWCSWWLPDRHIVVEEIDYWLSPIGGTSFQALHFSYRRVPEGLFGPTLFWNTPDKSRGFEGGGLMPIYDATDGGIYCRTTTGDVYNQLGRADKNAHGLIFHFPPGTKFTYSPPRFMSDFGDSISIDLPAFPPAAVDQARFQSLLPKRRWQQQTPTS